MKHYPRPFVFLCFKKVKMILVFGGTTEGRAAVETLDEAGQTYYY